MVTKMSKRNHHAAIQEIRAWTTEYIQKVLTDHGLEDCCEAIRRREVDGELLLTLTEGQLALWKRDLKIATIKKLAYFVQDVIFQPQKYLQEDTNIVGNSTVPAASLPSGVSYGNQPAASASSAVSHIRNSSWVTTLSGRNSPFSDSTSWDTDFSGDVDTDELQISSPANTVPPEDEPEVEYCNEILEKPPVPARPPALAPKPTFSALPPSNTYNLPKPPVPPESSCYGSVKMLVRNLKVPENTDQYDEEECESLDSEVSHLRGDSLALLLKKKLEARKQDVAGLTIPPVPNVWRNRRTLETMPPQHRPVVETPQHSSTLPRHARKPTQAVNKPSTANDGYVSDEYESIKENEKPVLLSSVDGTEYYLQPVQQSTEQSGGAPPLPAKPWSKPPDVPLPFAKPPSPPRRKSDDSSNSPGNSGDGVSGLFGEFFRKIRGPAASTPQDSRERTPTPEVKKAAATLPTPNHKPPLVDQRPVTFQGNQRPLPPTPEDKKLPEKPNTAGTRRTSKVGLAQQPWYHNVDRRKGEEMLRNGDDGGFLVRPSSQSQNPLTLTLWYNRRVYNIGIRHRADGRHALGTEKANEQSFASVEELVQNYQSEKIVLYSGGEKTGRTLLRTSPSQSSNVPAL